MSLISQKIDAFNCTKMKNGRLMLVLIEVLLLLAGLTEAGLPSENLGASDISKSSRRLAPCQSCKTLVTSFLKGMERTNNGHFEGGDTAWEEENNLSYKNSELRLTEIQEALCSDVSTGKDQCHEIAADNEHLLEDWWYKNRNAGDELLTWLCINQLEVCCPENHYGPKCLQCPGFPDNICSGHGQCKGQGTRKGKGECSCEIGYTGKLCNSCAKLHFESFGEDQKLTCLSCHKACLKSCSGPGAINCEVCREGWEKDEEKGCVDVNECLLKEKPCKPDEFCTNSEGTYSCTACDESCDGCSGTGPDSCDKCGVGYTKKDNTCIDNASIGKERKINKTRYLLYFGLLLAAGIIFKKNRAISIAVGVASASYIAASEYLLTGTS